MNSRENRPRTFFTKPSRAQQHHANDVNINMIMAKARKGLPVLQDTRQAFFGNFANMPTFLECNNAAVRLKEEFMRLPAKLRKEFDNDPAALVEFIQDDKNREQAEKLGILEKKEEVKPSEEVSLLTEIRDGLKANSTIPS